MTYYETEFGGKFNTREQAEEACLEDQTIEDFTEYFGYQITFEALLNWAMRQENFSNDFSEQIEAANKEYFDDMICVISE